LIVGDGPEHAAIEVAVQTHGLSKHVKLLGHLGAEALRAAYAVADLFIMPNVATPGDPEGFGLVTLEARAAGVPIVAADLEGISEAICEEDDGSFVEPRDWSAFVSSINSWLNREETNAERERRRLRVAARFAWSRIVSQYLHVFRETERGQRKRRGKQVANRH
jgi:glycosyltransferase involved in cell wall biosynthesis